MPCDFPWTYLPVYRVEIQWDEFFSAYDECQTGRIRFGTTVFEIKRHSYKHDVKVSNGPYSIGREWWTVENDPKEFDSLKSLIESRRPKFLD